MEEEMAELKKVVQFKHEMDELLGNMGKLVTKQNLSELSSFNKPPKQIDDCISAVLLLLGYDDLTWVNATSVLRNPSFMQTITEFNFEKVSLNTFKKLERIVNANKDSF